MGVITSEHPKCMTEISIKDTILSRQLRMLSSFGVEEVVMTTGYYDKVLVDYCNALHLPLKYTFVNNPLYDKTNYIYSIYCAKEALKDDDIILMHGDLVFESRVLEAVIDSERSCMTVSSTQPLPEIWEYMLGHLGHCIDRRGQEYLLDTFNQIATAMGCENPKLAIAALRQMMADMDLNNPVAVNWEEELEVLYTSVNPVRLKNNPVVLSSIVIKELYQQILS